MPYEKRTRRTEIKLTDTEYERGEEEADRTGVSLAEWVRMLIRRTLGMPVPGDDRPAST